MTESNSLTDGEELERIASCYLWNRGYVVFSDIKIMTEKRTGTGNIEFGEVTDIDALGFLFQPISNPQSFFIDCKNRYQLFKQVIWSYGIFKLMNFTDFLILRSSVPDIAQNFAIKHNIRIINNETFKKQVKDVDAGFCSTKAFETRKQIISNLTNKEKEFRNRLFSLLLEVNPFDRLKALVRLNRSYPNRHTFLDYQLFEMAWLSIGQIASKVIHLSGSRYLSEYLRQKFVGDFELKMKIASAINLIENDPTSLYKETPTLEDFLPPYWNSLVSLIKDIIKHPHQFHSFLRYNNFCINEFGIHGKAVDHEFSLSYLKTIDTDLYSQWNSLLFHILSSGTPLSETVIKLLT